MLREEVEQYTKLTGEDGWHVSIMKVGAYLDGYNKGLEVLDKIRAEIKGIAFDWQEIDGEHESFMVVNLNDALNIIDKYKTESEEK